MSDADATARPKATSSRGPGRPRRSTAEREAQRTRLLDAAFEAIRQHGVACSIEQMAAEAGVSKPVIHGEFGGKQGIAEAIALRLTHQVESQALDGVSGVGVDDVDVVVRRVLDALVNVVTDEPEVYSYLVRSLRADDRGLLDNALVTTLNEHAQVILRLVAPDVDPALRTLIAHGTFGFVLASIESWQTTGEPSRQALVDALVVIIAQAFTTLRDLLGASGAAR